MSSRTLDHPSTLLRGAAATLCAVTLAHCGSSSGSAASAPCDCPSGWTCCPSGTVCAKDPASCPSPADAGALLDAPASSAPDAGASFFADAAEAAPQAVTMVPSNSGSFGQLEGPGMSITTPAMATFDTSTQCTAAALLGDCTVVAVPGAVDACVCRSDDLTVSGSLVVTGSRALVVFAAGTVSLDGVVDIGGRATVNGAGACPGTMTPTDALIPLCGGWLTASYLYGGGGGALQVSAGKSITVAASGGVNAGGGGGGTGLGAVGGAGNAGGGILLEAPSVEVLGTLAANGGGGGGGADEYAPVDATPGQDGQLSANPAAGGAGDDGDGCPLGGYTTGGGGGYGASLHALTPSAGQPGSSVSCLNAVTVAAGGPGGAVGRIRINSEAGCACSGTLSPAATFGTIVFTTADAGVPTASSRSLAGVGH